MLRHGAGAIKFSPYITLTLNRGVHDYEKPLIKDQRLLVKFLKFIELSYYSFHALSVPTSEGDPHNHGDPQLLPNEMPSPIDVD
jgi:hypothetical protein